MGCIFQVKQPLKLDFLQKNSLKNSQNLTSNQSSFIQSQKREVENNLEINKSIKQTKELQNKKYTKKRHKQNLIPQTQLSSSNTRYNLDIKGWHENCEKHEFDLINLNNCQDKQENCKFLFLFEHTLFYYDEETLEKSESLNLFYVNGVIYITQYDKQNKNPTFKKQEGKFQINLQKKEFLLNGDGIEYYGKSQNIKYKGKFYKGEYQIDQQKSNTIISDLQLSSKQSHGIIIIDMDSGQQVNKGQKNRKHQKSILQLWCKYNQQISINDVNILKNKKWLTSSIIDSYALKLNILSECQYFSQKQSKRKLIKRILFLPSSLTTNFGQTYDNKKAQQLFKQELLEYSEMNFEITKIYRKVGFPVNLANQHWYFLLFDADSGTVEIFDSLQNSNNSIVHDKKLINTLFYFLQIKKKQSPYFNNSSGMQKDGYSCGYHVCNFMSIVKNNNSQTINLINIKNNKLQNNYKQQLRKMNDSSLFKIYIPQIHNFIKQNVNNFSTLIQIIQTICLQILDKIFKNQF